MDFKHTFSFIYLWGNTFTQIGELIGKGNHFDGIVSVSEISHNDSLFSSLAKSLKPGGSLVIREPALSSPVPNVIHFSQYVKRAR